MHSPVEASQVFAVSKELRRVWEASRRCSNADFATMDVKSKHHAGNPFNAMGKRLLPASRVGNMGQ